jgi:hypothetical protein
VLSQHPPPHVCGPQGGGDPASSGAHRAIMICPATVKGPHTSPCAHSAEDAQTWTGPIGVELGHGGGWQTVVISMLVMQQTRPGGAPGLYCGLQSTPLPQDRA